MEIATATSDMRPVELVTGPTVTLYRHDIETSTDTMEDGTERTVYTYHELRFARGEYELVRAGMLPPGVEEWTADLRRIERSALLDMADRMIAEANDHITTETVKTRQTAWTTYRDAVRAWKMRVRRTVDAEGFPQAVTYPDMPSQPSS